MTDGLDRREGPGVEVGFRRADGSEDRIRLNVPPERAEAELGEIHPDATLLEVRELGPSPSLPDLEASAANRIAKKMGADLEKRQHLQRIQRRIVVTCKNRVAKHFPWSADELVEVAKERGSFIHPELAKMGDREIVEFAVREAGPKERETLIQLRRAFRFIERKLRE